LPKKILAISPHTDDIEFACGGSISKWIRDGAEIYAVSFTTASAQMEEFLDATTTLGIKAKELLNFPVRNFHEHRQKILDEMVRFEKLIQPDLVLIPSTTDTHQDHQVIREEGFRAFKRHSLIGYEMPQNNLSFQTNLFVKLGREDLETKIKALECYRSQANRPYISKDFLEGLARVRGMQAGCEFAEAYEVMRWIE
jgi:LmbE family N-acetylglucosaminyl deacetylase